MANEKRLIDANALIDKVDESKCDNPHPQGMIRVNHRNEHDHFLRMILDAPTVDAVEVVHGRWRVSRESEISKTVWCTACGEEIYIHKNDTLKIDRMPYCPNCGAKMDGDNNEID